MDCAICKQQDEQDCRKRNVLYQSECQVCKVDWDEGGRMTQYQRDGKGLYYGESSRSLYERSKDRMDGEDDSHQVKHWKLDHPDLEAPPAFKFKMLSSFQDPLTRQLSESVRIERGGFQILNSKSEYSSAGFLGSELSWRNENHLP